MGGQIDTDTCKSINYTEESELSGPVGSEVSRSAYNYEV